MKTQKNIVGFIAQHGAGQEGIIKCLSKFFASENRVTIHSLTTSPDSFIVFKKLLDTIAHDDSMTTILKGLTCPQEVETLKEFCTAHDIPLHLIAITAPAKVRFRKSTLFRIYEQFAMHEWNEAAEKDPSKRNIEKCIEHVADEARFCNKSRRPQILTQKIYNYLLLA